MRAMLRWIFKNLSQISTIEWSSAEVGPLGWRGLRARAGGARAGTSEAVRSAFCTSRPSSKYQLKPPRIPRAAVTGSQSGTKTQAVHTEINPSELERQGFAGLCRQHVAPSATHFLTSITEPIENRGSALYSHCSDETDGWTTSTNSCT
jgi:hypothetical protein